MQELFRLGGLQFIRFSLVGLESGYDVFEQMASVSNKVLKITKDRFAYCLLIRPYQQNSTMNVFPERLWFEITPRE